MTRTIDEIRNAVREAYGSMALEVIGGETACGCGTGSEACCAPAEYYAADEVAGLPETAVSYGCGNPLAIDALRPGEVVLDLGSGAGRDCFLAAGKVGPSGRVIGVDMTDEMLALAQANLARLGLENVEFRKGLIEALPVDDASVDVIISNCVINLAPDKDAVFREAFRVLRPGGRFQVSDIVLLHALSAAQQDDLEQWAGCVSGALLASDYRSRLEAAGFVDVRVEPAPGDAAWADAAISGRRP